MSDLSQDSPLNTLPPLRIHHFMLWMVAVAALMSLYGAATHGSTDTGMSRIHTFQAIAQGMPQAIALATLGLGLYWHFRGHRFFGEVGHWLLAITVIFFLMRIVLRAILFPFFGWSSNASLSYWNIGLQTIEQFIHVLIFFVIGRRVADTPHWKLFCFANAIWQVLLTLLILYYCFFPFGNFLGLLSVPISLICPVALCLAAVVALANDLRTQHFRHWSHWCGVLIWLFTTAASLAFTIYLRFFFQA